MKIIRAILGAIILFLDRLFTPKSLVRAADAQAQVDAETRKLTLYQFEACPFCVKARRAIKRLGLTIQTRDVDVDERYKKELLAGGKEYQVPCLRIENSDGSMQWMYESSDIIDYLEQRYG